MARTTVTQRQLCYERHKHGQTYATIAGQLGLWREHVPRVALAPLGLIATHRGGPNDGDVQRSTGCERTGTLRSC